jgi:hypothetical protein
MTPESWLILTVAGAFVLVGIAVSPLAWVALHYRRSRLEQRLEGRCREIAAAVGTLEARLARSEALVRARTGGAEPITSPAVNSPRVAAGRPTSGTQHEQPPRSAPEAAFEPPLIAVPSLAEAPNEREALVSVLTERFAAIWNLADHGGSVESIARATGQPVGQIDLIISLRRQIDGTRMTIPHAPHG